MKESDLIDGLIVQWTENPGYHPDKVGSEKVPYGLQRPWVCLSLVGSDNWEDYLQLSEPNNETLEYGLFGGAWFLQSTNGNLLDHRSYGKALGALTKSDLPRLRIVGSVSNLTIEQWNKLHQEN